jgi:DNA-binding transcriptional ArsR family regulator
MKPFKTIKDPEAFQLLADETRRKIVFLLRAKEMTVSQIAADLNLTPQAVYHHIKRLVKADMVEVTREVRVDHLIESYYMTTAEVFNCSVGKTTPGEKAIKEQTSVALKALKTLGFKLEYDEKAINKLAELQMGLENCCESGKFEDKISNMEDVDFLTKQMVSEFAEDLSMSDKDFEKQQELKKKFRESLCSLVKQ